MMRHSWAQPSWIVSQTISSSILLDRRDSTRIASILSRPGFVSSGFVKKGKKNDKVSFWLFNDGQEWTLGEFMRLYIE